MNKREYKFRAWHRKRQEMVTALEIAMYPDGSLGVCGHGGAGSSDDFELMQYTGLKDREGRDIYDGDILEVTHPREGSSRYVIEFYPDCGRFMGRDSDGLYWGFQTNDAANSVIGNIFEHPHLLGKEN